VKVYGEGGQFAGHSYASQGSTNSRKSKKLDSQYASVPTKVKRLSKGGVLTHFTSNAGLSDLNNRNSSTRESYQN
jgi:hypothetical protein